MSASTPTAMLVDDDWTEITPDETISTSHTLTEDDRPSDKQHIGESSDSGVSLPRQPDAPFPDETVLIEAMQETARANLAKFPDAPLFHLDLTGDVDAGIANSFLGGLPTADKRQYYNCNACKKFMKDAGELALVDGATGSLIPLFWDPANQHNAFKDSVGAAASCFLNKRVAKKIRVTESLRTRIGENGVDGKYKHMSFWFPESLVTTADPTGFSVTSTEDLASMLDRIIEDYDAETVKTATHLLAEDKLAYAAKHKGAFYWLRDLIESDRLTKKQDKVTRHNLLHLEAASAYLGCINSLRSGAAATLLTNVKKGLSFEEIQRAWNAVMDPLAYMRPSAPPKAGNIKAAERLFVELGLTEFDLVREYLTTDGIPKHAFLYRQPSTTKPDIESAFPGIFRNVKSRETSNADTISANKKPTLNIPSTSLTFTNFVSKVLPTAQKVEYDIPRRDYLYFLITGRPGTKPLMHWHNDSNRASWYTWDTTHNVNQHGLQSGWVNVTQIITFPHMWDELPVESFALPSEQVMDKFKYNWDGISFLLCLEGFKEEADWAGGSALFPSFLKRELHGVRSTIEAYSDNQRIMGPRNGEVFVGGARIDRPMNSEANHRFRVTDDKGIIDTYKVVLFQ